MENMIGFKKKVVEIEQLISDQVDFFSNLYERYKDEKKYESIDSYKDAFEKRFDCKVESFTSKPFVIKYYNDCQFRYIRVLRGQDVIEFGKLINRLNV